MAQRHILFLALAAVFLVVAQAATMQAPPAKSSAVVFNPDHIVANVTGKECPVKNVLFDKKEFDVEELPELTTTLQTGNVSKKCQDDAVGNLMSCFADGSLAIKSGCCSKECAAGVKTSIESGCFAEYSVAICKDKKALRFLTGLTNAAKRCVDYTTNCEEVLASAPKKKANPTADADSTAAATPAAPTPAAATPAAKKSSGKQTRMSILSAVVTVAAVLWAAL